MTEKQLHEAAWLKYPFTFKNPRGVIQTQHGPIRYGIPEPKGQREPEDAPKGGDRIGFVPTVITPDMVGQTVAIFANIELKTECDRLKSGQIIWHNFVIEHGGISEIHHYKKGQIEITKTSLT